MGRYDPRGSRYAVTVVDLPEWTCRGMWSDEWQEIAMYRLCTLVRGLVTLVNKG